MSSCFAGVDGCPGGRWVIARGIDPDGHGIETVEIDITTDLRSLLDAVRSGAVSAVGIDIPIGLLDRHPRPADVAARRLLGPRRSSVFPTPVRSTLAAADYREACERSRQTCGKAMSKQAYNLLDRIRDIDRLIRVADQQRFVEAHPELAFVRLNRGAPLLTTKHQAVGRSERRALLKRELPTDAVDASLGRSQAPGADLLDAMALITTARRIALGQEVRLAPTVDRTGKRAEIAY